MSFQLNTTSPSDRLQFIINAANIGSWDMDIPNQQVWWDDRCKQMYGFQTDDIVPYEEVLRYIHPDDARRVDQAVRWALNPESGGQYDIQFRTLGASDGKLRWLHCRGQAFFDEQKVPYRFSGIAQEITQLVEARHQLDRSEARFEDMVMATPTATAVFIGRDMLIRQVNAPMLSIWGKDASVIGKILHVAMPELKEQPFLAQLQRVFDTGEPFRHAEGMAEVIEDGQRKTVWFNHAYNPLYDEEGTIYGVINTAIDVTAQVLARREREEKEIALNNTIELAELGTFSVDVTTNLLTASPRVADWFGFDSLTADADAFINGVGERDRDYVRTSLYNTLLPGSDGRYDVVHSVINLKTGHQRVKNALGRVYFDAAGKPLKIEGTAQDITAQQELQLVLEQRVQEQTEELATANKELAASNEELMSINEEYAAINEELEEANNLLIRSNDNLQTFAYVASHDLQEPLRKIQQFGDLLKTRFADSANSEDLSYLERMQMAASRMSTLIKDLLGFSRISTQRNVDEPVVLNSVVDSVVSVLDMAIAEVGAQLEVDALPTVSGDAVQLGQLFQNLISNALKFHRTDQDGVPIAPRIHISSQTLTADGLPPTIKPARRTPYYYRIDVTDNGIGFDEKYLDRIFQVFQRLHGRNQYSGTGVGLAICEKVVANHGGVITATSQPNQGATFSVYLPV